MFPSSSKQAACRKNSKSYEVKGGELEKLVPSCPECLTEMKSLMELKISGISIFLVQWSICRRCPKFTKIPFHLML